MILNLLYVEDDPQDMEQISRLLNEYFESKGLEVKIDCMSDFDQGFVAANNPHVRYDLVVTDTYRGAHKDRDAAALITVTKLREGRFTPVVVCSSGECPGSLDTSVFVNWADKSIVGDIERALDEIIDLGVPQLARSLHDELDKAAGVFLWGFLEKNWEKLKSNMNKEQLERIIRRRAALAISDLMPGSDMYTATPNRYGLEYYIYPSFEQDYFNLGDIVRNISDANDFRVILTPHCYLATDENRSVPKADHILLVKTVNAKDVIGEEKLQNAKGLEAVKQNKKLSEWARSPNSLGKPAGRYWYIPKFLEIPHLYCDFLKLESVEQSVLNSGFTRIATLSPPYAEAMQECFSSFYGSVGIPDIAPESMSDILDEITGPVV